jgi:hypothetical protein
MFNETKLAWQGVKSTRLMSIFNSKKGWKFSIKIQLTKSDPKGQGGGKCPASCQLGIIDTTVAEIQILNGFY